MIVFRNFVFSLTMAMVATAASISLNAQTASPSVKRASFAASFGPEKNQFITGQKAYIALMLKNTSNHLICLSQDTPSRVHIKRADGSEPPKTEYYRHLQGEYLPGDGPDLDSTLVVCEQIASGGSGNVTYDLSRYYDLSMTGKYSVYIEIYDRTQGSAGPEVWVRSNTAQFEIKAT